MYGLWEFLWGFFVFLFGIHSQKIIFDNMYLLAEDRERDLGQEIGTELENCFPQGHKQCISQGL